MPLDSVAIANDNGNCALTAARSSCVTSTPSSRYPLASLRMLKPSRTSSSIPS
ncbi:Uncharacterised protein [Mycobacteroides abscessus subsp. abscessus]|nr:Uncharacterised protein [Mycobacteroides abscessus subsp. abscessus]